MPSRRSTTLSKVVRKADSATIVRPVGYHPAISFYSWLRELLCSADPEGAVIPLLLPLILGNPSQHR